MKPLVIYHAPCADGFTSAWVAKKYFDGQGGCDFHEGRHGDTPPWKDLQGRDVVYLLDFSYKHDVMYSIAGFAKRVVVIDHHQSAEKELINSGLPENVELIFDMEHSGAVLTWMHFYPKRKVPELIRHVEDRDIWKFEMEGTKEITAYIFSHVYDFDTWDMMIEHTGIAEMIVSGRALLRQHDKNVAEYIKAAASSMKLVGYRVPAINAPYMWGSDICHILGEGEPFAVYWWQSADRINFGMRSEEDGKDVSEIARKFGGGGHKHAAGFAIPSWDALTTNGYPKKVAK